jgi:hypothetical protein
MMSQQSKRELLEAIWPRHLKANKTGKQRILDEYVAATGYHRKYAIRVLKHGAKPKGLSKKGRRKEYQGEVVVVLTRIWEICGRICSKRLKPFLPESEFINDNLFRYCQEHHITFTCSRPYHKNDQAHVEQKNWSVVRHTIGYDRLESPQELALLHAIYADMRLYINFFQPVLKLIGKEHACQVKR